MHSEDIQFVLLKNGVTLPYVGLLPFRRAHPKVGVAGGARSRTSKI